jgi:Rad51
MLNPHEIFRPTTMARLHYLYEQVGSGRERFVYYCSTCNCVLRVRRELGPISEAVDSTGRCIGCGRPLEGGIECMLAPVPDQWSDVFLSAAPKVQRKDMFQPASSIPHFCLGFPRLDALLRPFCEGRLIMLSGEASSIVAELAAVRAQLPVETGGLNSAVLFIDGGNRSDPYVFSSFAKQRGLRPSVAMRHVTSCRVFTFYQLAALVLDHLLRAVEDYGTRLVVISDILGTFNEPELEEREARRVLSAVEEGIEKVKKNALVIATLASPNKYDDVVASWADALVQLSLEGGRVDAKLIKHSNRLPGSTTFRMNQLLRATSTRAAR